MRNNEKLNNLSAMLVHMAKYAELVPQHVDDKSKEIHLSPAYFNFVTMMVESFFSVMSISLLVKEGLISNAIALIRIFIEQVSTIKVLASNEKAMSYYLRIKGLRDRYYNNEITVDDINNEFEVKINNRGADQFFDYGWSLSFGPHTWGRDKIIKEARFDDTITQDRWYLNLYAHGQLSWFQILKAGNYEAVDEHLIRITGITGVLFFHLRNAALNFFGQDFEDAVMRKLFQIAKFHFEKGTNKH